MGKWITPKVVIEKFIANQYIASCVVNPTDLPKYIDIYDGVGGVAYAWNAPDEWYQQGEQFAIDGEVIRLTQPFLASPSSGWYEGIKFYSDYGVWHLLYDPWEYQGRSLDAPKYDIEVYNVSGTWYARVYESGSIAKKNAGKDPANHS